MVGYIEDKQGVDFVLCDFCGAEVYDGPWGVFDRVLCDLCERGGSRGGTFGYCCSLSAADGIGERANQGHGERGENDGKR